MSVTVINKPHDYVPAHNDVEFYASSTQTAQPNFVYYVVVTVLTTGDVFNYRIPKDPTGNCYFNLVSLTRKFTENYYPYGINGFQDVTGMFDFRVNIGEEYGSTPAIHSGTNMTFTTWNASLTRKERATYTDLAYTSTAGNFKWLNSIPLEKVITLKRLQDFVLYWITQDYWVQFFYVKVYNSAGTLINDIVITNPKNFFPAYTCVNLGPTGLNGISLSDVTSYTTLPLIGSTASYYTVDIMHYETFRVNIQEPCTKFTDYTINFLNRKGAFDFIPMEGNHDYNTTVNKSYYQALAPKFQGSVIDTTFGQVDGPNPQQNSKRVLSSSYNDNMVLKSKPLTNNQILSAKDLFTSPLAFIQNPQTASSYTAVCQEDQNYAQGKNMVDKIVNLEVNVTGITENRQHD